MGYGSLQQWDAQSKSPAAPAGQQQAATAAKHYEAAGPSGSSGGYGSLGQWTSEGGYVNTAQSWYTGANQEGVRNGWDNQFVNSAMDQWNAAAAEGKLGNYFEHGTGVVTWDHASADGSQKFEFGDIYEDGKRVGNVYEQFDRDTANLMLADWMLDKDQKAHAFSESDPRKALDAEIRRQRRINETEIPKSIAASKFQEKVEATAEDFGEGWQDDATVLGGAVGGGTLGAGIGTAIMPGIGTAVGGGIGTLIGGFGAWANQDALLEQEARAFQITRMSTRENGLGAGIATGISQWGGFGARMISPLSNTVQGLSDIAGDSRVGDGKADFFRVDSKGERTAPKWLQVADVAASVGDSALQFASPVGAALFTTQMSATIGGEVGELAATGGKSFDYSRAGFDSIFTDDRGNTDYSAAAAGIGKVGIDFVQLGMARGLMGKVDMARGAVGEETLYGTGGALRSRLPRFLGGPGKAEREALEAGGHHVEAGGFRMVMGEDGKIVEGTKRARLSLLAPSEHLGAVSASVLAMRNTAKARGALTADDFYRAANSLATGERRFTTALVNGMGEGYEEAVQAILEPHSHGSSVTMEDIARQAVAGFAGGLGMGLGLSSRMPTADQRMMYQAMAAERFRRGTTSITPAKWRAMSEVEKRKAHAMSNMERSTLQAAFDKFADEQGTTVVSNVEGAHRLADAIEDERAAGLAKATTRTDGAFVISQHSEPPALDADGNLLPNNMPSDGVGASGRQTLVNLNSHIKGIRIQVTHLERELEEVTKQLAATPGDADLTERQAALTKQVADGKLAADYGDDIVDTLKPSIERMYEETRTPASVLAEAELVNEILRNAFNEKPIDGLQLDAAGRRALARAVALRYTRDPQDHGGSYPILVPQVSAKLTFENSNDFLQIGHAVLPSISGDYDGDKLRQLNQIILDDAEWVSLRAGTMYTGAGASVNVGPMKYEKYIVERMSEALGGRYSEAVANFASGTVDNIAEAIRKRYAGVLEPGVLEPVLIRFSEAVKVGDPAARSVLLDGLADKAGGPLNEFARDNLSNEWLWIDQVVRANIDAFQRNFAAHSPLIDGEINTDVVEPVRRTVDVQERRAIHGATVGTTVGYVLEGDDAFRQAQKLHYSSLVASVLSAAESGDRADVAAIAQLYEALGQGLTQSQLDETRSKDDITARVYARLERLALEASKVPNSGLNRVEALAVIANVRVGDVDIESDGTVTPNGQEVTLAQYLLRQSVQEDRKQKDVIFEASPELQAKHARLLAMTRQPTQGVKGSRRVNAARAFVEVVGSQQMFRLLGDDANVFGPHLTVEQFLRRYVSMDENTRRRTDLQLKGEAPYLGRDETYNLPYGLDELREGKISAYRSVVDSLLAVGHARITVDPKKFDADLDEHHLSGEIADQSYAVGKGIHTFHGNVRQAVYRMLDMDPRRDGELNVDLVSRVFEENPDFARQVMDLIGSDIAPVVFEVRGDDVFAAKWVYQMFTVSDPAEAEMIMYRNLLLSDWFAAGIPTKLKHVQSEEGQKLREFGRLQRRMHRVMWRLAAADDMGLGYEQFLEKLAKATNLEAFMRWVNLTPGIRGEQAPLTAWVDDTAAFDADKADAWSTEMSGSNLREAVATLRDSSAAMVKELAEEQAAIDADVSTLAAIRRVRLVAKGDKNVKLREGDQQLHDALVERIKQAGKLNMGLGPQAMLYQVVGAAYGFYPQAHTKGEVPAHLNMAGINTAMQDAFDYVTNYERVQAALTSLNLDAVSGNLGMLARGEGQAMDDHGRPVQWDTLDVDGVLELMSHPSTRPLARAILFPTVMERTPDGRVSPQLLVGKSLKSLLDSGAYKNLFTDTESLSDDKALRYLAMVETRSKEFSGKSYPVQRLVTDLLIAYKNGATRPLSYSDMHEMGLQAMRDVARVLQASGSIQSAAAATADGDPLTELLALVKGGQKLAALRRRFDIAQGETQETAEQIVERIIGERELQAEREKQDLLVRIGQLKDPSEKARLQQEVVHVDENLAEFRARMAGLLDDDAISHAISLYGFPPSEATAKQFPVETEAQKKQLVDYIRDYPGLMSRSSSSLMVLKKAQDQMYDSGRGTRLPDLTHDEWVQISNAIISVHLEDVSSLSGGSVRPFSHDDRRYWDRSFAYLVEPMLDPDSALVRAAKEVHEDAGRYGVKAPDAPEMVKLLDRTIFDDLKLGNWTTDVPRESIAANERLDASAAELAIAIAGNSPKRQAVISAATRRTFKVPGDELLSTVTLSSVDLDTPVEDLDTVQVTKPTGPAEMPLMALNNRFARSVVLTYTDAAGQQVQVDLLASDKNLGRLFRADNDAAASGLQEIHLERVRDAMVRHLDNVGLRPAAGTVDIAFFHPDSQPEGPDWFHNLFFEGTSFKMDTDVQASLTSGLWFREGALNPTTQRAALDASKLGRPAIEAVDVPTKAQRDAAESGWTEDFAGMLTEKTTLIMRTDLGFGKLEPEFYNAVYKDQKLRHWVRGQVDGSPVLWPAEQVIAFQQANVGQPLPIEDAQLWTPSDDVLRSMFGEQSTQGVERVYPDQLEINLAKVKRFRGDTSGIVQRFGHGISGQTKTVAETRIANRSRQRLLEVRTFVNEKVASALDMKVRRLELEKQEIYNDRAAWSGRAFDTKDNLKRASGASTKMLLAENIAFDWSRSAPFVGPRSVTDPTLSALLMREIHAVLKGNGSDTATGWIYRQGPESDPPYGLLNEQSLGNPERKALRIARGDLVVVELDSFRGDWEKAAEVLGRLTDKGAIIHLGSGDGSTDGRADLAPLMEKLNYEKIPGSVHVYQPLESTSRYQNQRAAASTLTATRGISHKNRLLTLLTPDLQIEENAAWVDPDNPRLPDIKVSLNLVPTGYLGGFGIPVESFNGEALSQVEAVRQQLRGLNTPAGRTMLREQSNSWVTDAGERKKADAEFDQAWDALMRRFDDNPGRVLPAVDTEFGTGDLIPLVDSHGRIVLYRHGYQSLIADDAEKLFGQHPSDTDTASRVAVFSSKPEPNATTHRGNVIRFRPRSSYGLSVELEIPLQVFGDKKILEWSGMKYLLTPKPDDVTLPTAELVEGRGIDVYASLHDAMSKESYEGLITNFQNAFSFFGIDFGPDVADFFGVDRRSAEAILNAIVANVDRSSVATVDQMLHSPRLEAAFLDQLGAAAAAMGENVDPSWVTRLNDDSSVSAQITRAIVTYLTIPGADVRHVLKSGGANDTTSDPAAQSVEMPELFTQFFDNARIGSPLRTEMFERFNQQLKNVPGAGTGAVLSQRWDLQIRNTAPAAPTNEAVTYKKTAIDTAVVYVGREPVGRVNWALGSGEIGNISILPEHRRKGLATGLLKFVQDQGITITHSNIRTNAGEAWVASLNDGAAPREMTIAEDFEGYEQGVVDDLKNDLKRIPKLPASEATGFPLSEGVHNNVDPQILAPYRQHQNTGSYYTKLFESGATNLETIKVRVYPPGAGIDPEVVDGNTRLSAALQSNSPVRVEVEHAQVPGVPWPGKATPDTSAGRNITGYLQYAEAHSSGDNPLTNGMSFDETSTAAVSQHSAAIAYQAIGAETAVKVDITKARLYADSTVIPRLTAEDAKDGGAWRLLTGIDKSSTEMQLRQRTPAEVAHMDIAREAMTGYRQRISKDETYGWTPRLRQDYESKVQQIIEALHLKPTQSELVDYWVRQGLGSPVGTDEQGNPVGNISGKAALETARDISWAVDKGYLPTVAGMVPLTHVHDLQLIFRANEHHPDPWRPRESMDTKNPTRAKQWHEWVEVSLGSAHTTENLFDPLYLTSLNGFMHTYLAATDDLLDLPTSMDMLQQAELLDEGNNRLLVSLDPHQDLLSSEPVVLDVTRSSLAEIIGGERIAGRLPARVAPASEIAKKREQIRQWRMENDIPVPVDVTMKNFRKNGAEWKHHSTNTSAFARMMVNLRVGTAMINPALYVSMGPEQWVRGTLDRVANLVTGQSTAGTTAAAAARISHSATGKAKVERLERELRQATEPEHRKRLEEQLDAARGEGLIERLGLTYRYTPEQMTKLKTLYGELGSRNDFKSMVYRDLFYRRPRGEGGPGRFEGWSEKYANLGAKMQDPTYGMRADTLARRYVEAALQYIHADPNNILLSTDALIAELHSNPQFLKQRFPEVHQAASNHIAQIRSLKETVLSKALRGIYEPLSESSNTWVNLFGNLVLKMPLLFSGYAMNVLTTLTGMQGLNDFVAMTMHGRTNGFKHPTTLFGRIQAKLAGREISDADTANFDMSSILEGIDLTRSFIRGGLTHTGLFMFGMMAGGLGLSGEDDETKRRRKLAEAQGAAFIYDPRRIENDFRNVDSVFLDWLPGPLDDWFQVTGEDAPGGARSMGQLHWMLKQFVSPIMGMEKFFETGDFRHVTWGFEDAIGSFPLINALMWDDAVSTANELAVMAKDQEKLGGPANMPAAAALLANGVGVYERMLFENAFVNMIYSSAGRYDKDPYKLPLRDSDGTIQRDIEGVARAQNLSVEDFIVQNRDKLTREIAGGEWQGQLYLDDNGEIKQGYQTRDVDSGMLHALTENRATMAFALALFTGQGTGSDYLRWNMPNKTREFTKPELSRHEAEAILQAAAEGLTQGKGIETLTADELSQIWKNEAAKSDEFVSWAKLDQKAIDYIAALKAGKQVPGGTGPNALAPVNPLAPEPLSYLDDADREHLTFHGARAVLRGLEKGSVKLGDASLGGIYIPWEMREKIQSDWMKEIVAEGRAMGLDQTKAVSRMKRMWYGPIDNPAAIGLQDLVWSNDISFSDKLEFKQLNTTYIMGPDGRPWATGFHRDGVMGALGLKPLKAAYVSEQQQTTGTDSRLNTTDFIHGINTGLRALELVDESANVPTDVEIGKSIEDAIREAAASDAGPNVPFTKSSGGGGFGFTPFRNFGGGGGFGGFSGGGSSFFSKMYALPGSTTPYGNTIPFINTSNPLIRRESVHRERVWSERGRLKQWQ